MVEKGEEKEKRGLFRRKKEEGEDSHSSLEEKAESGEKRGRVFRRWNPLAFLWLGFP